MAELTGEEILQQASEEIKDDIGIEILESFFVVDNDSAVVSIVLIPEDKPWHIVIPTTLKAQ